MTNIIVEKPKGRPYLPVIVAVAMIGVWQILHVADASDNIPYVIGYNLPICLVAWSVMFFGFARSQGWKFGILYFVILLVAGIAFNYATLAYEKVQMRGTTAALQSSYETAKASAASGAPPVIPAAALAASAGPSGPMAELTTIVKSRVALQVLDQKHYRADLAATGILGLLDPQVVAAGDDTAAQQKITAAQTVVAKYRSLNSDRFSEGRQAIIGSSLADNLKFSALTGYDESVATAKGQADQIWQDEVNSVGEIAAIYDLLQQARGRWTVQGNKFIFANADDLAAYNGHLATLRGLGADELAIRQQADEKNEARFDAMKQMEK